MTGAVDYTIMVADDAVQLIVSSAHGPRIAAARAWITEQAQHGPVRIIGPTQRAADDLARRAAQDVSGLLGVRRTTLMRLAAQWAAPGLAKAGRTRLAGLAADALAVRAVHRATAETPFEYFGPVQRFSGFGRAAARTLLELRRAEINMAALADDPRARDLARLQAAFDAELTRLGLADAAIVLQTAIAATPPDDRTSTLLLDVVPADALERRWMMALVDASRTTLAAYADVDPAVVGERPTALTQLFGVAATRLIEPEATAVTALGRARRNIFGAGDPAENADADPSVTFFSAPGEARECVEIARLIRTEAAAGRRFDDMAVLLPRPRTYRALLEDALRRAQIPMFSTARAQRPHPSGRALLALLACAAENLSASRFAEYLSMGQVPRLMDDGTPPSEPVPWVAAKDDRQLSFSTKTPPPDDPDLPPETDEAPSLAGHLQTPLQWERLLVDAEVRAGASTRWQRRLEGYEAELRLQLRQLADEQDAARAQKQADLRSLRHLIRFSRPILEILEQLPQSARWSVWIESLRGLAGQALREAEPVLAVLAELTPMGDVGPVGLEEVREVLHARLAFLQEDAGGHRFGKVFVAPIEEAAGRAFSVVFAPGLAQSVFPAPIYEDPLLLDELRVRLDPDLPVVPRRRTEERRRLRCILGAATERLFVSYPRIDLLQGRPRVPSFYAIDVLRAAHGRLPSLSALETVAAQASDSQWGWPAPSSPSAALDDSEYDLAVLGPHLLAPADAVRGRGRYLMDGGKPQNAFLVRALSAEARRWRSAWTYADGLIDAPEAQAALDVHHPTARPYSATALQHYADCPYRFLLQAVHRLRPRDPVAPVESLNPLTRGALFHEVQFHFLQRIKDVGAIGPHRRDEARGWLDEAQTRIADIYRDRLAPPIAAVWNKAMDDMRIDLHGWLDERLADDEAWQPSHAELAFGLGDRPQDDRDPASVTAAARILDRYRLRGAIDLIETNAATGQLRVTDHKTGRAIDRSFVHIGGGRHLQPVLYALAAQSVLGTVVTHGRLAYCTRRGGYAVREVEINDEAVEAATAMYRTIETAFETGFFPAAPRSGACTYCDYRRVCGPLEEQRVARKDRAGLVELEALRARP